MDKKEREIIMLSRPMDVLTAYPVRKSRKQKQAFREDVQAYVKSLGYSSTEEKGTFGARNLIIGDPTRAKYLVTAHYDTCSRLPFPNLITPENFWTFMAYQLFMVAVMFAIPAIPAIPVVLIAGDWYPGYLVWYGLFWVVLGLMMFGPANKTNSNDNTSGVVTVLEIAKSLPLTERHKVCFVLFDLEEAGLIGSSSYQSRHKKETKDQVIFNLDCVGDGDNIVFFPTKKLKKCPEKMTALQKAAGTFGKKSIRIHTRGFSVYPSDQANFPLGVGICALKKSKLALYMDRIHTPKDTILEETNVNILRAAIVSLITCDAAK